MTYRSPTHLKGIAEVLRAEEASDMEMAAQEATGSKNTSDSCSRVRGIKVMEMRRSGTPIQQHPRGPRVWSLTLSQNKNGIGNGAHSITFNNDGVL